MAQSVVKAKFGREHRTGYAAGRVLPVSNDDKRVGRGLQETQESCNDGGIGVTLKTLIRLELQASHQDGTLRGLPQEGLEPAALDGEGFYGR